MLPEAYDELIANNENDVLTAYDALVIELVPKGPHTPDAVMKDAVKVLDELKA